MSVTVRIPSPLRPLTGGAGTVECAPGTVGAIIDELEVQELREAPVDLGVKRAGGDGHHAAVRQ
ncbi:MAG: hypothetical protein ACKOGE_08265, partial [Actinomycetota bacterium]